MIHNTYRPICLILLLTLLSLAKGKVYSKNVPIMNFRRESGWLFLDRININAGLLEIQLKVKLMAPDYKIGSIYSLVFSALPN